MEHPTATTRPKPKLYLPDTRPKPITSLPVPVTRSPVPMGGPRRNPCTDHAPAMVGQPDPDHP